MIILHNGAPITDVTPGSTPIYVPGFAMTAVAPQNLTPGTPGEWLQIQADGVDVGDANPAAINVVADPARLLVTRGVGERSHVATFRGFPPADPFADQVILLMQNGEIIDRSQYARSLAVSGTAGSATAGVASDFPGGLAVSMQCAPSAIGGLVMGTGPELTMGVDSWCMEAFVTPRAGANGLQDSSQVLYTSSDDRSRLQWFLLFNTGRMHVRCNGFDIPAPLTVPFAARGSSWYIAVQFYPGSVVPWMWVGAVGDANATGDQCATTTPRPLLGPLTGPYIGYQPTDNFITSAYNVAMRITNAVRFAAAPTLAIPTALWPIP